MDDQQKIQMQELEIERLRKAYSNLNSEISQILGKALNFPWYYKDQINFPGATVRDGVCTGDHIAESLAEQASARILQLETFLRELNQVSGRLLNDKTEKND